MAYISTKHAHFRRDLVHASKLFSSVFTALPSILFLTFSGVVLYFHFHRFTTSYTRWHTRFGRDVIFQWVYFYVTRGWFLVLRLFKLIHSQLVRYIQVYVPENDQKLNIFLTQLCIFTMVLGLSLIPFLIFFMKFIYRDTVPNFLIWVGEDPWMRTEIGTSGHFLSRSGRFPTIKNKENAYRSRRSTSVDSELWKNNRPCLPRNCKSMLTLNPLAV